MQSRFRQSLSLSISGLVLALWLAAGGLIFFQGKSMRETVRDQIVSRDAHLLGALAQLEGAEDGLGGNLPEDRWLAFVENASQLRDILGVRLTEFETGYEESLPIGILATNLNTADVESLKQGVAIDHFIESQPLDLLFEGVGIDEIGESVSVLDLSLPVSGGDGVPVAYIRFWLDGTSISAEFSDLDRELNARGFLIWGLVGLFLTFGGIISYLVIRKLNLSLEERSRQLERSNRELEMAARSVAVGAITGHLMHGLKNPLAGLQSYLSAASNPEARSAADRMQSIVNETLAALRLESRDSKQQVGAVELKAMINRDCVQSLEEAGVRLEFLQWDRSIEFPVRELNLLLLVIKNLIQNASEACAQNAIIQLTLITKGDSRTIEVSDNGCGIEKTVEAKLFTPLNSSKEGGSGLGLAISKQMMRAIGGDLSLTKTDTTGSTFEVSLPVTQRKGIEV